MSYRKIIFIFWLALQNEIFTFSFDAELYPGDKCITVRDNLIEHGICTLIRECTDNSVITQVKMRNDNYTCGYEGSDPVVCCPGPTNNDQSVSLNISLNLSETTNCIVTGTNEPGVIIFKSDCEDFNMNSIDIKPEICDHSICQDLVCCPTKFGGREKKVCSHVDMPADEVTIRLHLSDECIVKGTNLTGRYQTECDYATRNPHMEDQLRNVCNDESCNDWYCCPIEPGDKYYCKNIVPLPNVKIVGPKCIDSKTGQTGQCRSLNDCVGLTEDEVLALDKCGDHCCLDYYCCPDPIQNVANQPAAIQKCWEYSKFVNKHEIEVEMNYYKDRSICGSDIKPVGGQIVEPGEYPHMAALGYEIEGAIVWNCGGSLISDEYILTAAHCLRNHLTSILFGKMDLIEDIEVLDCPEIYNVSRIIAHPKYKIRLNYHDIGLVQINRKVKFNYHIRPICLPSTSNLPQRYKSMGWGDMGNGTRANKLLKVDQELYSHEECQKFYNNFNRRKYPQGLLNETQMCAAGPKNDLQGTCTGDSGGPLLAPHPKMDRVFEIYGIVSTGSFCGAMNTPGIYTKVYPYIGWIMDELSKNRA